jgi:hypothetical protein
LHEPLAPPCIPIGDRVDAADDGEDERHPLGTIGCSARVARRGCTFSDEGTESGSMRRSSSTMIWLPICERSSIV